MEILEPDKPQSTLVGDASEKDETVTTPSVVPHASAAPRREKTVPLSSAPRRCVSKEMLEQTPTLEINVCLSK